MPHATRVLACNHRASVQSARRHIAGHASSRQARESKDARVHNRVRKAPPAIGCTAFYITTRGAVCHVHVQCRRAPSGAKRRDREGSPRPNRGCHKPRAGNQRCRTPAAATRRANHTDQVRHRSRQRWSCSAPPQHSRTTHGDLFGYPGDRWRGWDGVGRSDLHSPSNSSNPYPSSSPIPEHAPLAHVRTAHRGLPAHLHSRVQLASFKTASACTRPPTAPHRPPVLLTTCIRASTDVHQETQRSARHYLPFTDTDPTVPRSRARPPSTRPPSGPPRAGVSARGRRRSR